MATNQSSINMYRLINLLHIEAKNVTLQVSFLSNGAVLRYQRNKYKKVQAVIADCWKALSDGNMAAKEVLKRCSRLNGPV